MSIDAATDDLDDLRLRRYFRRCFPDWMPPRDWREVLVAHKLAVEIENRIRPTCVGVLLFADQPERFLPGAYVDLVLYNPGSLYNHLSPEMLYAGCQPVRRNQILAGFLRHYVSPVTGGAYMEAIGEGFLNLVRTSERLSGRRPLLEDIGTGMRLTIYAALREHRR